MNTTLTPKSRDVLGLNRYQWLVLFAAWLGWGFDVFDGFLFNYVAPNCVTALVHPHNKGAIIVWTGYATALLLFGWAVGGIIFGKIGDKIGRKKTLLLTMIVYGFGTAACALAPNIWALLVFRFISSLGIGGEWAAGASIVAEVVPEKRRVEAGALLYTSAPFGLFLAMGVNYLISQVWMHQHSDTSWRFVFAFGLLPVIVALTLRAYVKEPERWVNTEAKPRLSELFAPETLRLTVSGLIPAVIVLLTWWTCNAFIQVIASQLANQFAHSLHFSPGETLSLQERWKTIASLYFNVGGLIGTLLTIPAAKCLGRKPMFLIYFVLSSASLFVAFNHFWQPMIQLALFFPIGLTVFGVFGSFTFYLPELFPTRLRCTGSGFCYNVGRLVTVAGPLLIARVSSGVVGSPLPRIFHVLFLLGCVPLIGVVLMPLIRETKGRVLAD